MVSFSTLEMLSIALIGMHVGTDTFSAAFTPRSTPPPVAKTEPLRWNNVFGPCLHSTSSTTLSTLCFDTPLSFTADRSNLDAADIDHQPYNQFNGTITRRYKAPTDVPRVSDVELSLMESETLTEASRSTIPLIISPRKDSSQAFLKKFLKSNRGWVSKQMLERGAVLFRGFDVDSALKVESSIQAYEPNLNNHYRGTSPRKAQDGSKYVFSAADVPAHYPIAQHLEMSFLPAPPKKLFFSALKAPTSAGGETALADFRQVYQSLPNTLREKLATKKIRYTRRHKHQGTAGAMDIAKRQGWTDVFGTSSKAEVERLSKEENVPMRWEGKDKNTFVSEFTSEAFQLHPETHEPVWFNHIQVFHWSTFPAELFFAFQRTKDFRFWIRSIYTGIFAAIKYGILRHKMTLDASFGDGSPISFLEASQIRKAIHKNMVYSRWQKGDLLFIDNFSTSHGRQPTYDSGRRVVVSWSDPLEKSNEPVPSVSESIFQ